MDKPLLTIVIPTRNRPDFLELCLRSVFERQDQTPPVIVSDNSTAEMPGLDSLRNRYEFSYIRQSGQLSMTDHHNACLRLPQTPWVLLLHDDDELYPRSLGRVTALLRTAAPVGAIIAGYETIDEQSIPRQRWVPKKTEIIQGETGVLCLGLDYRAAPPATIYHRSAFWQAGGFADASGASADYPLVLRVIHEHGALLFPELIGRYRMGKQQATDFTLKGAERTLDETICMSQLTREIGVSRQVSDQLVDYNTWWVFRIIAAELFSSHPFFISRLFRKCLLATPATGHWKNRVRQEYPFLFIQPRWLSLFFYKTASALLPAFLKRRLGSCARAWIV